jgi:hypothetical protein
MPRGELTTTRSRTTRFKIKILYPNFLQYFQYLIYFWSKGPSGPREIKRKEEIADSKCLETFSGLVRPDLVDLVDLVDLWTSDFWRS